MKKIMTAKRKKKATYKHKSTMTTVFKPAVKSKAKKMEKVKSAVKSKAKKAKLKTKGK